MPCILHAINSSRRISISSLVCSPLSSLIFFSKAFHTCSPKGSLSKKPRMPIVLIEPSASLHSPWMSNLPVDALFSPAVPEHHLCLWLTLSWPCALGSFGYSFGMRLFWCICFLWILLTLMPLLYHCCFQILCLLNWLLSFQSFLVFSFNPICHIIFYQCFGCCIHF